MDLRKGLLEITLGTNFGKNYSRGWWLSMRIIDLHCYPSTQEWIDCQGPYVEALAKYWKRDWVAKPKPK